jgi:photosystem II stability/assembly factor-like uncharacterized protein
MGFWDDRSGIAFSDAINERIVIITTQDGGDSWHEIPAAKSPQALAGEGGFAASGTCLTTAGDSSVWIALGNPKSRIVYSPDRGKTWQFFETPMAQAAPGAGIFSLAFATADYGLAVGGNYQLPNDTTRLISVTQDGGKSWQLLNKSGINGYKSAIANIPSSEQWLCTGPTGVNYSADNGKTWTVVDTTGYHAIAIVDQETGWLSGANGRIAKIKISIIN